MFSQITGFVLSAVGMILCCATIDYDKDDLGQGVAAAACVLAGAIVFNRASAKTELAHAVELVSKLQHSHRNLQDEVTRLQFSGQDPAANQPADDEQV